MTKYKNAILKSITAIVVYLSIVSFSHFDPIKESFDDFAYDTLMADFFNLYESEFEAVKKEPIPKVNVFLIEDDFIDYYKLKDYGYVFPRKEMNKIIESLNYLVEEMKTPPKVVFIDYDFQYTELPYGRELSQYDKMLIDNLIALSKKTPVLIPKAEEFHFIEKYLDDNNLNPNIFFVSPNFLLADDLMSRRFESYFKTDDRIYPNVDYVMYLLNTNQCKSLEELKNIKEDNNQIEICGNTLLDFDVTQNRIIAKFFAKYEQDAYSYGFTLWDTKNEYQKIRSVSTIVEESVVPSSLENSVVMIGSDFEGSKDYIAIAHSLSPDPIKLPGIIMHLNALNSFHFYHGTLKNINPVFGSLIVFVIFLLFSYFEEKKEPTKKYNSLFVLMVNATMMSIVFFSISAILLLEQKLWFNGFAPVFTYQVLDIFYKIKSVMPRLIRVFRRQK